MISQTGRYALRVLGYLAERPGAWVQGREIAAATRLPSNYVSKILGQLRKKGFVQSQKGWGGGFQLKERARKTPIQKVLELFEGKRVEGRCVFELKKCDRDDPCPLHEYWRRIQKEYEAMLAEVTVGALGPKRPG